MFAVIQGGVRAPQYYPFSPFTYGTTQTTWKDTNKTEQVYREDIFEGQEEALWFSLSHPGKLCPAGFVPDRRVCS